jgi:hypothetical protein
MEQAGFDQVGYENLTGDCGLAYGQKAEINLDWLQRLVCNQIRSHGVWFGKRAVVGAVRVFEPAPGYVFYV